MKEEIMQMPKITVLTVLILIVAQTCAFAENLDKNKPILCAVMESHECIPNMPCKNVSAEEIHLPHFLLMDLKKGTITGTRTDGQALDSKIKDISTSDGEPFSRGWNTARDGQSPFLKKPVKW